MNKYSRSAAICLASAAPALVSGTTSPVLSLACAAVISAAGCSALGAVRVVRKTGNALLSGFAAIMTAAAVSLGSELIICAAFPSSFDNAPTFALTGAPLFFAACFASSTMEERTLHSVCCVAAAALLTVSLGILRLLFVLMPLAEDVSVGLILAGAVIAVIRRFIPNKEEKVWEMRGF